MTFSNDIDRPLATALIRAARAWGERAALQGEGVALTYTMLRERANDVAAALRTAGAGDHEAVFVACSNHPLDFVAFLGTWLAGAVVVPVHRSAPAGAIEAMQAKAACRFRVDLLASGQTAACVERLYPPPAQDPDRQRLLEGAALVIFTSGSTGTPKGVVLSHAAFAGKLEQNQRLFALGPSTVTQLVLNDTFSFGIWVALLTLMHGGTVLTRSRFEPAAFLESLASEGVTFVGVVPTMIRAIFAALPAAQRESQRERHQRAGTLRTMVIGGEPLGADLSAKLRAWIAPAVLYDVYGLTETSTSDFVLHPADYVAHDAGRPGTIGKPAGNVAFRIRREATAPADAPGELQLRTPYLMAGYLGDPALTAAAFDEGWFRTGDLATCDDAGFVSIVGRSKELIVRGGNKITPLEVERALCRCEGVAAAMVAGMPDPVLGQRIGALLVPAAGVTLDALAIRAQLAPQLEKFKFPDHCFVGRELPTGRTGKIERGRLAAIIEGGALEPLAGWGH